MAFNSDIHTYMNVYVLVCMYVRMYVCMYYVCVRTYVFMYMCVYTCMFVYACIYMGFFCVAVCGIRKLKCKLWQEAATKLVARCLLVARSGESVKRTC